MNNSIIKNQSGFTLLEVLVALVLGIGILTAAISMQIQHRKGFKLSSNKLEMQTNAKFAFNFVSKSLRAAGAMGCRNSATLTAVSGEQGVIIDFNDPKTPFADFRPGYEVLGYEYTGAGLVPTPPTGFTFVSSTYYNANSDILTVAGGYGEVYRLDETVLLPTHSGFNLDMTGVSQVRVKQSQYGMISSCLGAKVFKITSSNAAIGAGNIQWGGGGNGDDNSTGQLGEAAEQTVATGEREFRRAAVVSYFVGMTPLNDANGVPTLYQDVDGVSNALIEGIEEIQIQYGLSTSSTERNVADTYLTADGISETMWADVVSVRIGLIMRSAGPVYDAAQTQNITLDCVNYTQATKVDQFSRATYCSEVSLRNRLVGSR